MAFCLSVAMHLFVPFLFHEVTSLHPLHFIEMISTIFPLITIFIGRKGMGLTDYAQLVGAFFSCNLITLHHPSFHILFLEVLPTLSNSLKKGPPSL